MELFNDLIEWARATRDDGCGIQQDDRGIYRAENWEGKSMGEFNPAEGQGFLN